MAADRRGPGPVLGLYPADVVAAMRAGRGIRRRLKPWGTLHIDRAVPFLCVYRRPAEGWDRLTAGLITGETSYAAVPGETAAAREVALLLRTIAGVLVEDFGACLLLEVWKAASSTAADAPLFRVVSRDDEVTSTAETLEAALCRVRLREFPVSVAVTQRSNRIQPMPSLLGSKGLGRPGCRFLGLEVQPIYRDDATDKEYPFVHRRLRRGLSGAIRRAAFEFTTSHTTQRPQHFHMFGRRKFVRAVWEVDGHLAQVSNMFDPLFLTTPRNTREAWMRFRSTRFNKTPRFSYPPLPFDPALAKRRLFDTPIERVEDPTLAELFRAQQEELDRKISMVSDRGTPRFRHESIQLYGSVDNELLRRALDLLEQIPSRTRESGRGKAIDAAAFAQRARDEMAYLQRTCPSFSARVEVRDDVTSLMVSRGQLLVPGDLKIPASRVEALLQHEIGTHIVTYYNGGAQPLRQLRNGLPGYEELQEGIAVLAEHLVGGLSRSRLRILAARVVAVRRMIDRASFVDVFRELDRDFDFAQRTAFTITTRVFRGGGQVKDAVYLRGLIQLLNYIADGGAIEPLLVGKIALRHLPIIRELQWRDVLAPPQLRPRYLDAPETETCLSRLRGTPTLIALIEPQRSRKKNASKQKG